jgi:uncharacterized Zn-binding protein involved in type VI secretion
MSNIAKLGDQSDHGGTIIQASGGFTVDDIAGVVDGDLHQCPIHGHGTTSITATGNATGNGRGIVRSGDKAGCGATIIGTGSGTLD